MQELYEFGLVSASNSPCKAELRLEGGVENFRAGRIEI